MGRGIMFIVQHVKKLWLTLLLVGSAGIMIMADQSMDTKISSSQMVLVSEQTYPKSCRYVQTILHAYPDKVSEILFIMSPEQVLQSHKGILMIPYAWLVALEQSDSLMDEIIRNYIATRMQSSASWLHWIDWDKVSIGLIVVCLAAISIHLYKIERSISRIDHQIKSNTLFWLCTLPNKMRQKFQNL